MELSIEVLTGYLMENWLMCLSFIGLALSLTIPRDRLIIFTVICWAIIGHYISPYIFGIEKSWRYWELFGASVGFFKLITVVLLVLYNCLYRTKLAEGLCFIFICQIGFHGMAHIDWVIIRTNFLSVELFSIDILDQSVKYHAYKIIAQALNILCLVAIYGNWLFSKYGEHDGVCKSVNNNNSFYARVYRV
ncbi:MAG: hypothetical protein HRT37_00965 [Alteromonadaceae bacterium]|nr:hypothetical protein [Alteromonadaceae bacterium]